MATFLTIVHLVAAVFMILVVLLQAGKGAGMGAAFGGSSQASMGGSGGMTLFAKLTATAAAIFMITSLSLAYLSSTSGSMVENYAAEHQAEQAAKKAATPAAPAPAPATAPAPAPAAPAPAAPAPAPAPAPAGK